jgi:hypothetical protein
MSASQGGRSLRNKAPIDYTSCFYKSKVSRDETRSRKSDEEPALNSRPRKKKQKLSQESETSPEDVDADRQPSGGGSEPLLDKANEVPALDSRPREKKQKLSQESETPPEDVDADRQPSDGGSEPLLDKTNEVVERLFRTDGSGPSRPAAHQNVRFRTLYCSCSFSFAS